MIRFTIGLLCSLLLTFSSSAQATWQQTYASATPNYSLASTQNGYIFAHKPDTLLVSATGGTPGSWVPVAGVPSGNGTLYSSNNALFIITQYGVKRSGDNGKTWDWANHGLIGIDSTRLRGIVHLFGDYLILLHNGSATNKVLYSSNNGRSWSATLHLISQGVGSVVVHGYNAYLITSGTVYKSDDGGSYWENLNATFPTGAGGGATVAFSNGTFIMKSGSKFYTSQNEGISWTLLNTTGLPANALRREFIKSPASDTLYLSTQVTATSSYGLYYSADRGATWNVFDDGLPSNKPIGANEGAQLLIAHNGYMFSSPDSNGIYRTATPVTASTVIPSGVSVATVSKKDIDLRVYPNPAVQTLDVSFTLANSENCTVWISDIFGKTVLKETSPAATGPHKLQFDVASLASGTYLMFIRTAHGTVAEKFVKQ